MQEAVRLIRRGAAVPNPQLSSRRNRRALERAREFCFRSRMALFENLGRVMAPTDTLKLSCQDCGRQVAWSRDRAFRAFGADASPYEVRRAAKCGRCGSRRVDVTI